MICINLIFSIQKYKIQTIFYLKIIYFLDSNIIYNISYNKKKHRQSKRVIIIIVLH